jgi:serine/threonine-protein kinase
MADAFVDVAAQPPLYSVMLGLPDDLGGLEAQIGLDIADDLADLNGVTRAGILVSGVASQNRVLQRHVIGNGAFWRTFEFEDDSQAPQSILSSPLDFDENGGSIIFSLPNALHGYMVIDAAGNRIDEAPIELMIDPAGTDGRVRTGLSCFGCHQTIVEATDDVAPFVDNSADFDAADKATVATLYSAPSDFNTLQGNDTMAYHAALIEANVEPLAEFEQITTAVDRFEEDPITLEQAAAELGIAPDVLEYELPNLGPALEALRDGGTIKRGTWTGLFPETICALNLGQSDDGGC